MGILVTPTASSSAHRRVLTSSPYPSPDLAPALRRKIWKARSKGTGRNDTLPTFGQGMRLAGPCAGRHNCAPILLFCIFFFFIFRSEVDFARYPASALARPVGLRRSQPFSDFHRPDSTPQTWTEVGPRNPSGTTLRNV